MEKVKALNAKLHGLADALMALQASVDALEDKVGAHEVAGFHAIVKECAELDSAAAKAAVAADADQKATAPHLDKLAQNLLPKALCAKQLVGVDAVADMIAGHIDEAIKLAHEQATVVANHVPIHDMSADDAVAALAA